MVDSEDTNLPKIIEIINKKYTLEIVVEDVNTNVTKTLK